MELVLCCTLARRRKSLLFATMLATTSQPGPTPVLGTLVTTWYSAAAQVQETLEFHQGDIDGSPVKAWCMSGETGCSDPMLITGSPKSSIPGPPAVRDRLVPATRKRTPLYDTGMAGPRNQGRAHNCSQDPGT